MEFYFRDLAAATIRQIHKNATEEQVQEVSEGIQLAFDRIAELTILLTVFSERYTDQQLHCCRIERRKIVAMVEFALMYLSVIGLPDLVYVREAILLHLNLQ